MRERVTINWGTRLTRDASGRLEADQGLGLGLGFGFGLAKLGESKLCKATSAL